MYPKIKPFNSFFLKTKDNNHSIYVEECGNRNGVPTDFSSTRGAGRGSDSASTILISGRVPVL